MIQDYGSYIEILMVGKLTRNISVHVEVYLEQLIEEDPEINCLWTKFLDIFSPSDLLQGFSRYDSFDWKTPEEIIANAANRQCAQEGSGINLPYDCSSVQ